ncbi:hypothetical protein EII28_04360 [Fusobacterium nucleatum]|jgi:putative lipoprotein|uniref:Lipoprotein n=1 Tax=Fusobacterium nucleatum TaxID=851 RepID=A0A3P1VU11_FUSNU|nr:MULTISPECIES: hypothetical protein [Fusobacterium]QYR59002.1 hypothetical protein JY397_11755 [Fusobacterium polymorphum]RRD37629.1 hypothetical protein EII28_04360 [Fusobacterium nucleatum]
MKKILLGVLVIVLLVSCGKPKAYTLPEKERESIFAIAENNQAKLEELNKNMEEWKKLAEKGDEQGKKEYQEWQLVQSLVSDEYYVEVNYKALKADGK